MIAFVIRTAIIASALLITALLVPDVVIDWAEDAEGIGITLLLLALTFGVVNSLIRPIARYATIPLSIATLGMFSVVLNGVLLLLVAFMVDLVFGPLITVGGFPPDLGIAAVATAAVGSFIISAISTALQLLIPDP